MGDLQSLAHAARLGGSATRAVQALTALRQRFLGSTAAGAAAFMLGRIAQDGARDHAGAAGWFQRYLSEQPVGAFAAEAAEAPRRGRGPHGRRRRRPARGHAVPHAVPRGPARGLCAEGVLVARGLERRASTPPARQQRSIATKIAPRGPLRSSLAAFGAGAAPAAIARADEAPAAAPSIVAILCAPGDRFGQRVVAELESLGFVAVVVDPGSEPLSRASLELSARRAGAMAAIRAVPSERGIEVWIADRVTGKTVLREAHGRRRPPDRDAALALRVVELLRASLLEVALPTRPAGRGAAARRGARDTKLRAQMSLPAPDALVARPAPTLRLALAPGVLLSPGGVGPAASSPSISPGCPATTSASSPSAPSR